VPGRVLMGGAIVESALTLGRAFLGRLPAVDQGVAAPAALPLFIEQAMTTNRCIELVYKTYLEI
jgi:hypothetical protein